MTLFALMGIAGRLYETETRFLWTGQERARFLRSLAPGVTSLWMRIDGPGKVKSESFKGSARTRTSNWQRGGSLADMGL